MARNSPSPCWTARCLSRNGRETANNAGIRPHARRRSRQWRRLASLHSDCCTPSRCRRAFSTRNSSGATRHRRFPGTATTSRFSSLKFTQNFHSSRLSVTGDARTVLKGGEDRDFAGTEHYRYVRNLRKHLRESSQPMSERRCSVTFNVNESLTFTRYDQRKKKKTKIAPAWKISDETRR